MYVNMQLFNSERPEVNHERKQSGCIGQFLFYFIPILYVLIVGAITMLPMGGGGYNSSFSSAPCKEARHFASMLQYMHSFFIRKVL